MKSYTTDKIRNVVLIGASHSGKTMLSEAMLFEGKVIDRRARSTSSTRRVPMTSAAVPFPLSRLSRARSW